MPPKSDDSLALPALRCQAELRLPASAVSPEPTSLDGFLTLDVSERIVDANLTLAVLLGVDAHFLEQQPLVRFVDAEDADRWHAGFNQVLLNRHRTSCLLKLQPQGGSTMYTRLYLVRANSLQNVSVRVVVVDISEIEYRQIGTKSAASAGNQGMT